MRENQELQRLRTENSLQLAALEQVNLKVGGLMAGIAHGMQIGQTAWDEAFEAMEQARKVIYADDTRHPDEWAVHDFAVAMVDKMAKCREKGRSGWEDPEACPVERLAIMLIDHLHKGDPLDIGCLAMMLYHREGGQAMAAAAKQAGVKP